jgi:hypothetical protein
VHVFNGSENGVWLTDQVPAASIDFGAQGSTSLSAKKGGEQTFAAPLSSGWVVDKALFRCGRANVSFGCFGCAKSGRFCR